MAGFIEKFMNRGYCSSKGLGEGKALSTLHHLFSRGHVGKVLCVSASEDGQYVVTGGDDYTTRIWKFDMPKEEIRRRKEIEKGVAQEDSEQKKSSDDSIPTESFVLRAVLYHELEDTRENHEGCNDESNTPPATPQTPPATPQTSQTAYTPLPPPRRIGVTASAFIGDEGPVVSGLSEGMVTLFDLKNGGRVESLDTYHKQRINELCVGTLGSETLVATACEDKTTIVFELSRQRLTQKFKLPHEDPVKFVRFLRSGGHSKITFVTCTDKGVQLWDMMHELKGTLMLPDQKFGIVAITATCQADAALIFASDGHRISAWAIEDGDVNKNEKGEPDPVATYDHKNQGIDCDQAESTTDYVVHQGDDYTIKVWNLLAVNPEMLAKAPPPGKTWTLLIKPGKEEIKFELVHKYRVLDFRVVEDEFEGPVLISACGDTAMIWDIEGDDAGEITAQLRSMRFMEVVLPPILLIITFVQVSSFAFGPSIKWSAGVEEHAQTAQHYVLLDFEILTIDTNMQKRIFWASAISSNAGMLAFLFAEVFGLYEKFDKWERSLQNTTNYRGEERHAEDPGYRCKPYHLAKTVLNACQLVLGLMIYAASTFLIAPISKICAKFFDCVENDETMVVRTNMDLQCWTSESGHAQMALFTGALFLLFLLGLAPYAVVVGDPSYVQQDEVLDPCNWVENWSSSAARKATVLNQGPWHPNPRFIFRNNMVEFVSKACIPFISVLLAHRPKLQMAMLSIVGFIMLMAVALFEPRTEPVCSVLVFSLRLFAFLMMLIGLGVTILDDPNRWEPLWALGCVSVLVPAWTTWRIITHAQSLKVRVTWKSTAVPVSMETESVPLLPTTP